MKHENVFVALAQRDMELAELRAYRDKTEAALVKWRDTMQFVFAERMGRDIVETRNQALGIKLAMDHAKELGLWREPPKDGGA